MSLWPTVSFILWLLGAIGMVIELGDGTMSRQEKILVALFATCWPLVMIWALVQWGRGK